MTDPVEIIDPLHFVLTDYLSYDQLHAVQAFFSKNGGTDKKVTEEQVYIKTFYLFMIN